MSDDKKQEKPLEDPEVYVTVVPKDDRNPEHKKAAGTTEKKVREEVKKAVEQSKQGGKDKQFDAAESGVKRAGEGTDPKKIDRIRVRVVGKDSDGDGVAKEWTVTPKEGKPIP